MKILLIEDNPFDQMVVTRSLREAEDLEYELTLCGTLAEALQKLSSSQFDVIVLDLCLPDSEGLETCRRIVSTGQHPPVVVMTSADDRLLAINAIRSGAEDYLVKGAFDGSAIARVLRYAIERQHFHRELIHQERHFRQMFGHVPAIIWTTDQQLTITSVMGAGLSQISIEPQQMIGKSLAKLFQITVAPARAMQAHHRALMGDSAAFETESSGRFFEVKTNSLRDPHGAIIGTIGVALDVTDRQSLDREISFARLVQVALLPAEHPYLDGYEIFGGSYPAKRTCGDWFDYLQFPDGSLGLVVGDVSGKGFGPAILSATIAAYLDVLAENHTDIREILSLCNRLACRRELERQFAVLILGQLQPSLRRLVIGGAGDGAMVIGRDGRLKHRTSASGIPIGLMETAEFAAPVQIELHPGDIVLLLTDGFREAGNAIDRQFGESRIAETVAAHANASAREILQFLWQTACRFAGDRSQKDDMSGIVIKVLDS